MNNIKNFADVKTGVNFNILKQKFDTQFYISHDFFGFYLLTALYKIIK